MNSTHDLGGTRGHGPIDRSQKVDFLHNWERKVFSMTLSCGMLGKWNLDESRHARETMKPSDYLNGSYYEHWLHGLEELLLAKGLIAKQELETGSCSSQALHIAVPAHRILNILSTGSSAAMKTRQPPKFMVGSQVLVKNFNPKSHTRAPQYIRGCLGVVVKHHGAHIFADQHAKTGEKMPMHLYNIRFASKKVWGSEDAEANATLHLDLFERYLEPAQ